MKILLLENKKPRNLLNLTELFGLSRSGKSYLLENIKKNGKNCLFSKDIIFKDKLFNLIGFFIKHPFISSLILFKINTNWIVLGGLKIKDYLRIFLMRNSYLGFVFAKYNILSREKEEVYLD